MTTHSFKRLQSRNIFNSMFLSECAILSYAMLCYDMYDMYDTYSIYGIYIWYGAKKIKQKLCI